MERTSAPKPAQYAQDVADELGWTYAGKLKSGHRRFEWVDQNGNLHVATTGSGAHSDRDGRIDAQKVRSRMRRCMAGDCSHIDETEGAVNEAPEGPPTFFRPGESVLVAGQPASVIEEDGEHAVVVNHMTGDQDIVPVTELAKAASPLYDEDRSLYWDEFPDSFFDEGARPSEPEKLYHAAPSVHRESIREFGLLKTDPSTSPWTGTYDESEDRHGVFAFISPDVAEEYIHGVPGEHGSFDIWEIDHARSLFIMGQWDDEFTEFFSRDDIPPSMISLYEKDVPVQDWEDRFGKVATAPDFSNMSMIFLEVPESDLDTPDDAHLTLFLFEDLSDDEKEILERIVKEIPHEKMQGTLSGYSLFGENEDILVAEIDLPDAFDLYDRYKEVLDEAGLEYKDDYDFKPHITLKRDFEGDLPEVEPTEFTFDTVAVAHGDCSQEENVPLTVTAFLRYANPQDRVPEPPGMTR